MIVWILATLILIAILGLVMLYFTLKKRKEGKYQEPDYRTFFYIGLIWFPMGVIIMFLGWFIEGIPITLGSFFFIIGLTYFIIGYTNKNKWKSKTK